MEIIDLRSDTVTKPTPEMLQAMFQAQVGDDMFGEDPSVIELENYAASIFGKEKALFCPSGTMTNQIAIKLHTQPGDEVICDKLSHIYHYEGGGIAFNSGASVKLLDGINGKFTVEQVKHAINPNDIHAANTSLVVIENTCNKGGGSIWDFEEIKKISLFCREKKLALHLDGARLFNALTEKPTPTIEVGKYFDTISICLSKGLGAPVGSLLIGSIKHINQAKRIRKVFGGAMRQAGYLAKAGTYALQNHITRLKTDHENAQQIKNILLNKTWVKRVLPVETNIVIFELNDSINPAVLLQKLKENDVLAIGMGSQFIRFVTHLNFRANHLNRFSEVINNLKF